MNAVLPLLLFLLTLPCYVMSSDEIPLDTSKAVIAIDSNKVTLDSTLGMDSTFSDSTKSDSTSIPEMRDSLSFEEKYLEHQKKNRNTIPRLSVFDSLLTYFTSDFLNRRNDIDMSFYHDAGDYFKFAPSFFVNEYQNTPMRKTVQPFGLSSNRLNILFDGNRLQPFEHVPEPDGMVDINDIPTALDDEIYILPGPVGQLFGGSGSVASLITRPKEPKSYSPESALLADKGGYAYNYVRGRYTKNYNDGRYTNALIEYHNSEGSALNRESDQYQYFGDFSFPLSDNYGIKFWGLLNDRKGPIVTHPDLGGSVIGRDKFDRTVRLSLTRDNNDRTTGYEFGYKHVRQGSYLRGISDGRFDITAHGAFIKREWISGSKVIAFNIDGNYTEYAEGYSTFNRKEASTQIKIGWLKKTWRFAATLGTDYVEDFKFLPNAALVFFRKGEKSAFLLSAGFSQRAPTMHELYLPYQKSSLYGSNAEKYVEQGNSLLNFENQTTASLSYDYGSQANNIGLSVTGGSVRGGIDWHNELINETTGSYRKFVPINHDFSFVNASITPRLKVNKFISCIGAASYNYLDYDKYETKPYSPEYQISSGLELNYYWTQKLMHLFAYGEIVYVGPYNGYDQLDLGQEMIANAKLSFSFGNYKMHFVFQNVLGTQYQSREYITNPGRLFYYGFTWNFLN